MNRDRKLAQQVYAVAIVIAMALIGLSILVSCGSKKTITETVYVHDTLHIYNTDTVKSIQFFHVHDTVHDTESHYVTIKENGDTLKEVHYYHTKEKVVEKDSGYQYHNRIDSVLKAVQQEKHKEVVTPMFSKWKSVFIVLGFIVVFILLSTWLFGRK